MAYYGGYGNYPGQFMSYGVDPSYGYATGVPTSAPVASIVAASAAPPSTSGVPQQVSNASNAYRVNLPAYYAGPSYSTTSDNDFNLNSMPVAPAASSNAYPMGSYAATYVTGEPSSYGAAYPSYSYAPYDPYTQYSAYSGQQVVQQQRPQQTYSQVPARDTSATYSQSAPPTQQNTAGATTLTQTDEFAQLAPQIEAAYEAATHHRRQPVIKRQVITVPGTPGKVQQVVRRLPTPTPDIVERVFIVKPQRDVVNLVIERPGTPPAQYKDRTVMGKQRRPLINPRIIRVAPRQTLSAFTPFASQQFLQYQAPFQYNSPYYFQQQYQQYQQQQPPQYQYQPTGQYLQALPGPNVQSARVPPSASSTFQNYPTQSQTPTPSTQQQQQATTTQYESPMSQGQVSQAQMSSQQHSQSQVMQQQQQQQQQQPSQSQVIPSSAQLGAGNMGGASTMVGPKGFLIAPVQYDDYGMSYGNGYSTGFPSQSYYNSSVAYPLYGR